MELYHCMFLFFLMMATMPQEIFSSADNTASVTEDATASVTGAAGEYVAAMPPEIVYCSKDKKRTEIDRWIDDLNNTEEVYLPILPPVITDHYRQAIMKVRDDETCKTVVINWLTNSTVQLNSSKLLDILKLDFPEVTEDTGNLVDQCKLDFDELVNEWLAVKDQCPKIIQWLQKFQRIYPAPATTTTTTPTTTHLENDPDPQITTTQADNTASVTEDATASVIGAADGSQPAGLKQTIDGLIRMVMMLQLNAEESNRASGDSGIKQTRAGQLGTRPYHSATHINNAVNAIHDHSQNRLTVGMGEVQVVINGVEFRTRHNDFALVKPHSTSSDYGATEEIAMPDVPPAVLNKATVTEQVAEMQEWFKAWKNQRHPAPHPESGKSHCKKHEDDPLCSRDYRKYFKPVLCYLEAGWTHMSKDGKIEEAFESDRHVIDADTWKDLVQKVRYNAFSGTKDTKENYSFLPFKIHDVDETTGQPIYVQWNARIVCAPVETSALEGLEGELPFNYIRLIDDLSNRMRHGKTMNEHLMTRNARFELFAWKEGQKDGERDYRENLLDDLMIQIPGKDNYIGDLNDDSFGSTAYTYKNGSVILNTAYYHRWYRNVGADANGQNIRARGFADRNIFMAKTTQKKVPAMSVKDCDKIDEGNKFQYPAMCDKNDEGNEVCCTYQTQWTYAIPLEIIFLTPLYNWNPYNLKYANTKEEMKAVKAGGRNGKSTKPYNGTHRTLFYRTPIEFFDNPKDSNRDLADTSESEVYVMDPEGVARVVTSSGTRIMLPSIGGGVGKLRTRYPISPLYNDGSQIYKEVEALKDVVLRAKTYKKMYHEDAGLSTTEIKDAGLSTTEIKDAGLSTTEITCLMGLSEPLEDYPAHKHEVHILLEDLCQAMCDKKCDKKDITLESEEGDHGHSHALMFHYQKRDDKTKAWLIDECDNEDTTNTRCFDKHPRYLDCDNDDIAAKCEILYHDT